MPSIELADLATFSALTEAAPVADAEATRALLRRLEAATGHALATVVGDHVALTDAGRLLGEHAVAISATLAAARDDVTAVADGRRGALRIGVGTGVSASLVGDVIAELARAQPALVVTPVAERDASALAAGDVDAVVGYAGAGGGAGDPDGLATCALLEDPWVMLVASAAALAGRADPVPARALAELPLVAPRSPAARASVAGALAAAGIVPSFVVAVDDAATVHALVAAGIGGGAVLARSAADPWHAGTVVLTLDHLLTPRVLRLAWRAGTTSPGLEALRRAAAATCARATARRGLLGSLIAPHP